MRLFSEDKNLIYKILNAVLFIWTVTALVILFSSVVDYFFEADKLTEKEYEVTYCKYYPEERLETEPCTDEYVSYNLNYDREIKGGKRMIVFAIGQFIIVAGTIVVLNLKPATKKETKKKAR